MIGNSEVGMGSVSVEPFVFRKPCTNDLIVSRKKSFRHPHIHLTQDELTRRMAEAISEGFQVASTVLDAFLKTREIKVVDRLQQRREQLRLSGQQKAQGNRQREHPLAHRNRGITQSTRWAAVSAMRRAPQEGQKPRRLHEKATSFLWPHSLQRSRRNPCARMVHLKPAHRRRCTASGIITQRARAKRQDVYQDMKSGRSRLRIISLLKRSSQNDRGFRFSR